MSLKWLEKAEPDIKRLLDRFRNNVIDECAKVADEAYCDEDECHAARHIGNAIRRMKVEKECLCYKSHTTTPISCGCYCHDKK